MDSAQAEGSEGDERVSIMENLNFIAKNDSSAEVYDISKESLLNDVTVHIAKIDGKSIVNICDGSVTVLTLTGKDIEVLDWYGWGCG